MENAQLLVLIDGLPHLLADVGLSQHHLDLARAELDRSTVRVVEATALVEELRRIEAQLRTSALLAEEEFTTWAASVAVFASKVDVLHVQHLMLLQVVRFLAVVRAVASARSRAHLFPSMLLAAASAAVLVYALTGGVVVPGFRSFVRFSFLMLGFLFASDRPRSGV